jgi:type VI secretion system protein ImpF
MSSNTLPKTTRANQLLPALLDRLIDHKPHSRKETPHERIMSKAEFRQSVLRDLSWLLNTTNAKAETSFVAAPQAERSVVNFGIPALSGHPIVDDDCARIETAIKETIRVFEPRILTDTLMVRVVPSSADRAARNHLSMEIKGQLWCEPYPLELLLRSHIDLESGQIQLEDAS